MNLRFEFELREKLVVAATGTAGRAGGNCFTEREKRERERSIIFKTHTVCRTKRERERERCNYFQNLRSVGNPFQP